MNSQAGTIKAIAWRPTDSDPMQETSECHVLMNRGIDGENRKPGKREVTLLSAESWADVCTALGADVPWTLRRANVLVSGVDLSATIGRALQIGDVKLQIHAETKPCGLMDEQQSGLLTALVPECRGGVYGQVLTPGTIRVGDAVTMPA